jgi:rare lipoprotein A
LYLLTNLLKPTIDMTRIAVFFFSLLFCLPLSAQDYGLASYYADRYHGRKTAYGEIYDKNKMTCSHNKHPYGTMLRVTRLDNKRSVVVKVIDKGPYTKGRIVDLSRAAAEQLGIINDGVVEVMVEVVGGARDRNERPVTASPSARESQPAGNAPRTDAASPLAQGVPPASSSSSTTDSPSTAPRASERAPVDKQPAASTAAAAPDKAPQSQPTTPVSAPVVNRAQLVTTQDYTPYGMYRIRLEKGPEAGYGVQLYVITKYENVLRSLADLQGRGLTDIIVSVEKGANEQTNYKIILGPFESDAQAKSYQANVQRQFKLKGFVVNLSEKKAETPPRP